MSSKTKIAIGISVASGALIATWLLTGTRKERTKYFISKNATGLQKSFKTDRSAKRKLEDFENFYG